MKKLAVRTQLTIAFGGLATLIVAIAGVAIISFFYQYQDFERYVNGVRLRSETAHLVRESVDLRAIAARNLVLVTTQQDRMAETKIVRQAHGDVELHLRKLNEMAKDGSVPEEARRLIDRISRIEASYAPVALSIIELALRDQHEESIAKMNEQCRPLLAALIAASNEYATFTSSRSAKMIEDAGNHYVSSRNTLLISCALAIGLALLAGWLIMRNLLDALGAEPQALCAAVARVADGDLSEKFHLPQPDGRSVLAALQRMQISLSSVVQTVRDDSAIIATASAEISSGNNDLSSRTEQQAGALEETASSMEELTSTVRQNADNARQANMIAVTASQLATQGGAAVDQVVNTMGSISDASSKIVDIIGVIDGIAFQTNILALNAAVEAARAGEQGRGFAVVASEVRNLAQRSASAAKEIKALIDNTVGRVDVGARQAADAGAKMIEVVTSVKRVADMIAEIMSASQEQSAGIEQVNQAMAGMDQVTQQNASLVEEAAAAAESLRDQAANLVSTVSVFKVANDNRSAASVQGGHPAPARLTGPAAPDKRRQAASIA